MRFRGALSQRDAQIKTWLRNWATKPQQGEAGEMGNKSHNKSGQQRDWVTPRATTSRGRETVPHKEPHQVEPETDCATKASNKKARWRSLPPREPQQGEMQNIER